MLGVLFTKLQFTIYLSYFLSAQNWGIENFAENKIDSVGPLINLNFKWWFKQFYCWNTISVGNKFHILGLQTWKGLTVTNATNSF